MCSLPFTKERYSIILSYLRSGQCIDHASIHHGVRALVAMPIPFSRKIQADLRELTFEICSKGHAGLASAVLLASKYATRRTLGSLIEIQFHAWAGNAFLGRQVGALYPRMKGASGDFAKFLDLIRQSRNIGAQEVYRFHKNVENGMYLKEMLPYLRAPNPTLPRGINHSKILLSKTFLKSKTNSPQKQNLLAYWQGMPLDDFQRRILL